MKTLMILLGVGAVSYSLDISYILVCSIYLVFLVSMSIRSIAKEITEMVKEEMTKQETKEVIGGFVVKKTDPDSAEYLRKYMPN